MPDPHPWQEPQPTPNPESNPPPPPPSEEPQAATNHVQPNQEKKKLEQKDDSSPSPSLEALQKMFDAAAERAAKMTVEEILAEHPTWSSPTDHENNHSLALQALWEAEKPLEEDSDDDEEDSSGGAGDGGDVATAKNSTAGEKPDTKAKD